MSYEKEREYKIRSSLSIPDIPISQDITESYDMLLGFLNSKYDPDTLTICKQTSMERKQQVFNHSELPSVLNDRLIFKFNPSLLSFGISNMDHIKRIILKDEEY